MSGLISWVSLSLKSTQTLASFPRSQKCLFATLVCGLLDIDLLKQITCLYDMDIVFQSNGNFDEVYLYVRDLKFPASTNYAD